MDFDGAVQIFILSFSWQPNKEWKRTEKWFCLGLRIGGFEIYDFFLMVFLCWIFWVYEFGFWVYNLKYLFFNFNKRKNMSCLHLSSSSIRTPKNTNPDFKHNNTCPDFLAFSCPFLSTKHKPCSRSSQTTKPRYTKSQLKPRFSHLSINNETSSK